MCPCKSQPIGASSRIRFECVQRLLFASCPITGRPSLINPCRVHLHSSKEYWGEFVVLHADRIVFHKDSIHQKATVKQPHHNNRHRIAIHRVLRWKMHMMNMFRVSSIVNTQPLFPPSQCCHHHSSNAPVPALLSPIKEKVPFSEALLPSRGSDGCSAMLITCPIRRNRTSKSRRLKGAAVTPPIREMCATTRGAAGIPASVLRSLSNGLRVSTLALLTGRVWMNLPHGTSCSYRPLLPCLLTTHRHAAAASKRNSGLLRLQFPRHPLNPPPWNTGNVQRRSI
ncbi:hypothetical protein MOQ_007449 [Trypanosoma cruzi marinkellei]|uniref:Uncharacterized protein n=1 Tax=Trypanosoma cruzi marinkellei TaxID=85056 RepID=K2N2I9_TRYCR|nr:hypothetical protein MOQ_007449 [Trypanosoma cruzi marinkellei]